MYSELQIKRWQIRGSTSNCKNSGMNAHTSGTAYCRCFFLSRWRFYRCLDESQRRQILIVRRLKIQRQTNKQTSDDREIKAQKSGSNPTKPSPFTLFELCTLKFYKI